MGDIFDLFFELSNEGRMAILEKLLDTELKLSRISLELDLPVQEVSRQLSRLDKQGLVQKTPDGSYMITSYAEQVLRFVPSIKFLSDNVDYLKTHDLNGVPYEFIMRIGELSETTYEGDVMKMFHRSEQMIEEAEEYFWVMSDQILMSSMRYTEEAIGRGIEHRFLGPRNIEPPEEFYTEAVKRGIIGVEGKASHKFLDKIDVMITLTDKEVQILFPSRDGSFDYSGFHSVNSNAFKWAKDVYEHYWASTDILRPDVFTP
jgi:predicted transcriptional regulator